MRSSERGTNTSGVAVTDISPDGIWILASGEELFMPFDQFPWLRSGTVDAVLNVIEEAPGTYHWPDLDIDLGIDSIRDPGQFPLQARVDA
ncbi:MAG: DUF2442 domain-containing protein [Pseudomonadales bacterium]|nr:DUF2442 domain-containing protein [Pseudomonadales bacterium]